MPNASNTTPASTKGGSGCVEGDCSEGATKGNWRVVGSSLEDASTTKSPEAIKAEYYKSYDVMTGIRIAATLGGIIVFFCLFLLYKTRCKTGTEFPKPENEETSDQQTHEPPVNQNHKISLHTYTAIAVMKESNVLLSSVSGSGMMDNHSYAHFQARVLSNAFPDGSIPPSRKASYCESREGVVIVEDSAHQPLRKTSLRDACDCRSRCEEVVPCAACIGHACRMALDPVDANSWKLQVPHSFEERTALLPSDAHAVLKSVEGSTKKPDIDLEITYCSHETDRRPSRHGTRDLTNEISETKC